MSNLKNKVVWITGASSGIGEALVKEYARLGAKIILSARRKNELKRVQSEADLDDNQSLVLPLDLALHDEMPAKVEQALAHFGHVDILINNGGISQRSLVLDTDFSVYKKLIDVDYLGTVALTKALLPHFVERQSGHFAAVTSLMGKFASPLRSGYCGAKHAVHGFLDGLRMEHHDDNIKVTLICPGYIQTNVSMNALTADGSKQQTMDNKTANGLPPEKCAKKIISAIRRNKMEVNIGGAETLAAYVKRFFPSLVHTIARKVAVT